MPLDPPLVSSPVLVYQRSTSRLGGQSDCEDSLRTLTPAALLETARECDAEEIMLSLLGTCTVAELLDTIRDQLRERLIAVESELAEKRMKLGR